jgi:hypothetical protein
VENREHGNTFTHYPKNNTKIFSRKPLGEKTQLEGEATLLSFLWYGNNASTKENALSMELLETCGLLGCYRTLTPSGILSNFPLLVVLLCYGTKYNNIEWNPFSS